MPPPPARVLGRRARAYTPRAGNPFAPYYTDSGLRVCFEDHTELYDVLTTDPARAFLMHWGYHFTWPAIVRVNAPYAIDRPAQAGRVQAFEFALLLQIAGKSKEHFPFDRIRPNELSTPCQFSCCFRSRVVSSNLSPAASEALVEYRAHEVDTLALFSEPFIVTILAKKNTFREPASTPGEPVKVVENWDEVEGCTNCIAAGLWHRCDLYQASLRRTRLGPSVRTETTPGQTSAVEDSNPLLERISLRWIELALRTSPLNDIIPRYMD